MFYRKKITIPEAGDTVNIPVGGCAVDVESMGLYSNPEQFPSMFFDDGINNPQPLYPQSTYVNESGKTFQRIAIRGTEESAGDDLYLLISDVPMQQSISTNAVEKLRTLMPSFSVVSTNDAQTFSEVQLINDEGFLPVRITVSCTGNNIKYSIESEPVQGDGLGTVLNAGVDEKPVEGANFITAFTFISEVLDEHGTVTVHLEY